MSFNKFVPYGKTCKTFVVNIKQPHAMHSLHYVRWNKKARVWYGLLIKNEKIIDLERGEMIANLNDKLFENITYFCFVVLCIETANLCALG